MLFSKLSPGRKWLLRLLLTVAAIALAVIGWAYYRGTSALRDAISEAERTDPFWRIEQIEAKRLPIPDAENSALVINAAKRLIDSRLFNQLSVMYEEPIEDLKRFPAAPITQVQRQALLALLKPYQPAKVEFQKVIAMPRGRFRITYSPDFVGTVLESQNARNCSLYFRSLACERIAVNDIDGAMRAIKGLVHSARSIGDEPCLISILIRFACESMSIWTIEFMLAQSQLSETALSELQNLLEGDSRLPLFTLACRGERAGMYECAEFLKTNPGFLKTIAGVAGRGSPNVGWNERLIVYVPGSTTAQQADLLRFMNRAVEISNQPIEEHIDAYTELEKTIANSSMMTRLLCPAIATVATHNVRLHASLRCTIAAIAAERFRLNYGHWPETLDELAQVGLLKSELVDPFDGKPLRWKTTDAGQLVYSVGKDRIDNGGNVDPDKPVQDGYDIGFRLFDPARRGEGPRPSQPPAEPDASGPPNS